MTVKDWIFVALFVFQIIVLLAMFVVWQKREEIRVLEKKEEEAKAQAHECKCGGCCHSHEQVEQKPSVRLSEVLEAMPREPIQRQTPYSGGVLGGQAYAAKPLRFPRGTIFTFGDISDK